MFLYKLCYHFLPYSDIEPDQTIEQHDEDHMKNINIYLVWRKFSMLLLLPILLVDFGLNIAKYKLLENHIHSFNNYKNQELYQNHDIFYYFRKERNIFDFLKVYIIFTSVVLIIEFFCVLYSFCKYRIWEFSKKYFKIPLYLTILLFYTIYLNPLVKTFQLISEETNITKNINDQDLLYSYSYYFIVFNMFKDIAPLVIPFILSLSWSSRRLKSLFFYDLYIGQIYNYSSTAYILLSGGLLLFIVQFLNSYYVSASVLFLILSVYIPLFVYKNDFKYVYENNIELDQYNSSISFVSCCFFILSVILFLAYMVTISNHFFVGVYKIYSIDITQIFFRLLYRTIYYRIVFSDYILEEILRFEKSRYLYREKYKDYNRNMRKIEDSIYTQKYLY